MCLSLLPPASKNNPRRNTNHAASREIPIAAIMRKLKSHGILRSGSDPNDLVFSWSFIRRGRSTDSDYLV